MDFTGSRRADYGLPTYSRSALNCLLDLWELKNLLPVENSRSMLLLNYIFGWSEWNADMRSMIRWVQRAVLAPRTKNASWLAQLLELVGQPASQIALIIIT